MSGYQQGNLQINPSEEELFFDCHISYAGSWWSLNDQLNFKVTPEGFGSFDQTYRRKETTSEYFEGTYTVHKVRDSTKRTIEILVYGADQSQVTENINKLIQWFTEDAYNIRIRMNEHLETWSCGAADYKVDRSHVLMHNTMARVTFQIGVNPRTLTEVIL